MPSRASATLRPSHSGQPPWSSSQFAWSPDKCLMNGVVLNYSGTSLVAMLRCISSVFWRVLPVSETDFIFACRRMVDILQIFGVENITPVYQTTVVDIAEHVTIIFLTHIFPSVSQEIVFDVVRSFLKTVDAYIIVCGDFFLQLRVAAIYQLLQEDQGVSLMLSSTSSLRRPSSPSWPYQRSTPTPMLASFDSVHLDSPSQVSPSLFYSCIPSLSSLVNTLPLPSTSASGSQSSSLGNVINMHESTSVPTIASMKQIRFSDLTMSSNTPNFHITPTMEGNLSFSHASKRRQCNHPGIDSGNEASHNPELDSCGSTLEQDSVLPVLFETSLGTPSTYLHLSGNKNSPNLRPNGTAIYGASNNRPQGTVSQSIEGNNSSLSLSVSPGISAIRLGSPVSIGVPDPINHQTTPGSIQQANNNSSSAFTASSDHTRVSNSLSSPLSVIDTDFPTVLRVSPARYSGRLRSTLNACQPRSRLRTKKRVTPATMSPAILNLSLPLPPKRKRGTNKDQRDVAPLVHKRYTKCTNVLRVMSDVSGLARSSVAITIPKQKRAKSVNEKSVNKENQIKRVDQ